MTEQELIEKIARLIDAAGLYDTGTSPRELANQILTLIKEALPELAKEAGCVLIPLDKDEVYLHKWAKFNGYVKPETIDFCCGKPESECKRASKCEEE